MAPRTWVTPAELDSAAESFARAYRGYLTGMAATLAGVFDRPNATTPKAAHDLREATFQTCLGQLGHASTVIRVLTSQAVDGGLAVVSKALSEEDRARLDELVNDGVDIFLSDHMAIAMRDWVTVRRAMRRFTLEAQLQRSRYGLVTPTMVRKGKIADLKFRQSDRAGRQWESAMFIRNMVRHHLVQVQADSACFARIKAGGDLLRARWAVDHEPITFSISGKHEDLPPYVELRETVFHPNSTARLELP